MLKKITSTERITKKFKLHYPLNLQLLIDS